MGLLDRLKSKKVLLGVSGVGAALMVVMVLVFMSSSGSQATPERERSTPRTRRAVPKPAAEKQPATTPLFETLKAWKDPFRGEDPQLLELQDKINAVKKEIEYLKVTLEEKRLRQEIKKLDSELKGSATSAGGAASKSTRGGKNAKTPYIKKVVIKAIMITDDDRKALLISGREMSWVREGEEFDGWEIREINSDSVVVARGGKTYVYFYDRSSIGQGG